jgi:hypothetical protein
MAEPTPPPPQPQQQHGIVLSLIDAVKGMSLLNAAVFVVLLFALVPAYILYRAMNDEALMGKLLSHYEEITSERWPCTLRIASVRGGGDQYSISTGFAYQGSERWTVNVVMDRKPSDTEMISYCETLNLLIDFMRNPDARSPNFPGTEKPLVQMYPENPVEP